VLAVYRLLVPVMAAVAALGALISDSGQATNNVVVLAAVGPFLAWAVRPRLPLMVLVVTTGLAMLVATRDGQLEAAMFMLSVAATLVGSYEASNRMAIIETVLLAAVPVVGATVVDNDTAGGLWLMGVVLPLLLSRIGRRQVEMAEELAATRAALADQRVLDERRRIARDVHDSVGHGLAAVLLHITGARHVLGRDPAAADEALAEAEVVGRRSMSELRDTLGLLRTETFDESARAGGTDGSGGRGAGSPRPPVPSIASVRRDDSWNRFTVTGDPTRLAASTATSLHRVAEEAFANAVRHAPDARTTASLAVHDAEVVMTIESFGALSPRRDGEHRPGYGIVGMSERMAAVGGVLDVGPTPSGWLVRATVAVPSASGNATAVRQGRESTVEQQSAAALAPRPNQR